MYPALIALTFFVSSCVSEPILQQPVPQIAEVDPWPKPMISNDPKPFANAPTVPPYESFDGSRGAKLFLKCVPCHSIRPDGIHGIGPKLFGVAGRKIAGSEDYRYSDALRAFDNVWSDDNLDAFLMLPRGFAPGNKMTFRGIDNPQDRADLILFLKSQR